MAVTSEKLASLQEKCLVFGSAGSILHASKWAIEIYKVENCPASIVAASGELFTLTYGALVAQLIKDYERDEDVNKQLDKMGYNIGLRIIDDFLAKNPQVGRCNDLREVADVIVKQGFRAYLGVTPSTSGWSPAADEFSIMMDMNPLSDFVEFPQNQDHRNLNYSQMICGVIRGALEMIHLEIQCWFVQDQLKGDSTNEIRVRFVRKLEEAVPAGED